MLTLHSGCTPMLHILGMTCRLSPAASMALVCLIVQCDCRHCHPVGKLINNIVNKAWTIYICRYAVPAEKAACFEAALRELHGDQALASLTAKHMYCPLPVSLLKELGVKRFLQMPGYAVLTYPVSAIITCWMTQLWKSLQFKHECFTARCHEWPWINNLSC